MANEEDLALENAVIVGLAGDFLGMTGNKGKNERAGCITLKRSAGERNHHPSGKAARRAGPARGCGDGLLDPSSQGREREGTPRSEAASRMLSEGGTAR